MEFEAESEAQTLILTIAFFSAPLIGRRAVVYFDDWNAGGLADKRLGERRAFEELLAEHPDLSAEPLDELNYKDKADVKVFLVTRTPPPGGSATASAAT